MTGLISVVRQSDGIFVLCSTYYFNVGNPSPIAFGGRNTFNGSTLAMANGLTQTRKKNNGKAIPASPLRLVLYKYIEISLRLGMASVLKRNNTLTDKG